MFPRKWLPAVPVTAVVLMQTQSHQGLQEAVPEALVTKNLQLGDCEI